MRKYIFILLFLFPFLLLHSKINLIWQVPKDAFCETDWLNEVLAGIEFNEIHDGKYSVIKDNSIIIVSNDKKHKCKKYYEEFHKRKYKFALIQLSDEFYSIPDDHYKHALFVLRHYWHEKYGKNVIAFPLGYKSGFMLNFARSEIQDVSHRPYVWSFAGQINKSTRLAMAENMKKIDHYHLFETSSFGDPNALPPEKYRALLLNSIFVPSPRGWDNLESFRVYEALECGCIPIVERNEANYFAKLLGPYPFPSVASWDEAPALIQKLLANPMELENLRISCQDWWQDYKIKMKSNIKQLITKSFDK